MELKQIGYIRTDYPEKFGIPRQSGLVDSEARIYFLPEYRNPDAFNGLEGFSYIWILWGFDVPEKQGWSATVKPPRLGGNTPKGVFATRSPFRPNPIGLSSVTLEKIEFGAEGPVLYVKGADLRDKTRIFDIKPYLGYADSHSDSVDGFAAEYVDRRLEVVFPAELIEMFPIEKRSTVIEMLAQDPRPSYQEDSDRSYGAAYAGMDIHFKVANGILTVYEVVPYTK